MRFGISARHGMRQVKVLKAVKHPTSNEYATHGIKVLNCGERKWARKQEFAKIVATSSLATLLLKMAVRSA